MYKLNIVVTQEEKKSHERYFTTKDDKEIVYGCEALTFSNDKGITYLYTTGFSNEKKIKETLATLVKELDAPIVETSDFGQEYHIEVFENIIFSVSGSFDYIRILRDQEELLYYTEDEFIEDASDVLGALYGICLQLNVEEY